MDKFVVLVGQRLERGLCDMHLEIGKIPAVLVFDCRDKGKSASGVAQGFVVDVRRHAVVGGNGETIIVFFKVQAV